MITFFVAVLVIVAASTVVDAIADAVRPCPKLPVGSVLTDGPRMWNGALTWRPCAVG